jgi:hypothetical protein
MKEESKELVKWYLSMAGKYLPMSIDEFINEVLPYETMELFCNSVEQAVSENKIDPKNLDTLINILKYGKLQLSKPQHDKSKTKVKNKITVEYLQNLIETLELQKQMNTNIISTPPEGLKCKDNIKPNDLKFIFTRLEGRFHKSVTETNFVNTFQVGVLPDGWQPVQWIGNNPELATLFYLLTGIKPIPSIVTKYFNPESTYTNTSAQRINNKLIINLVTAALK